MHVLIAAHDFYPDPGSGGTGRYVYETARRLVDRGHRVSVVTRRRGDVPRRGTVDGVRVARYDFPVATERGDAVAARLPGAARAVATAVDDLADGRPDAFSVQGHVTGLLADRAIDEDVPRIATFHSPWPTEYRIRTRGSSLSSWRRSLNVELRLLAERRLLARCDRVVALSEFMAEQCRRVYGPSVLGDDYAEIPGGVDVERFRPDAGVHERIDAAARPAGPDVDPAADERDVAADGARAGGDGARADGQSGANAGGDGAATAADSDGAATAADSDRAATAADSDRAAADAGGGPAFLTVRRLSERMGHDLLLEAFGAVLEEYPTSRLFVAGDGPLRDELEALASSLGVADRTTFLGYVPDEDLPAAYASADAFVLPTRELEGFGLATLEALASGTPVVGTPVGGTVEILGPLADRPAVPDETLARSVDADALADGMRALAALDADALADAGDASRRYARERFRWERTVDELAALYEAVDRGG